MSDVKHQEGAASESLEPEVATKAVVVQPRRLLADRLLSPIWRVSVRADDGFVRMVRSLSTAARAVEAGVVRGVSRVGKSVAPKAPEAQGDDSDQVDQPELVEEIEVQASNLSVEARLADIEAVAPVADAQPVDLPVAVVSPIVQASPPADLYELPASMLPCPVPASAPPEPSAAVSEEDSSVETMSAPRESDSIEQHEASVSPPSEPTQAPTESAWTNVVEAVAELRLVPPQAEESVAICLAASPEARASDPIVTPVAPVVEAQPSAPSPVRDQVPAAAPATPLPPAQPAVVQPLLEKQAARPRRDPLPRRAMDADDWLKEIKIDDQLQAIELRSAIDDWLRGSANARREALTVLVGLQRMIEPLLIATLLRATPERAELALEGLKKIESERLEGCLREVLGSSDPDVRIMALRLTQQLADPMARSLLSMGVEDPSPRVRRRIVPWLLWQQGAWAVERLWKLADDRDPSVKWAALDALVRHDGPEVKLRAQRARPAEAVYARRTASLVALYSSSIEYPVDKASRAKVSQARARAATTEGKQRDAQLDIPLDKHEAQVGAARSGGTAAKAKRAAASKRAEGVLEQGAADTTDEPNK